MFRAIVMTQWKWTRTALLLATIAAFGLPLAAVRSATESDTPQEFIIVMQRWGVGYAALAAMVGLLVALAAWGHDHQGRHVYALSLPVSRARYTMMRFGAGALFVLIPALALLFGALMVAFSGSIPFDLQAFPEALTLRFAFAAFVAFALFFTIGSATTKTAAAILGVVGAVLIGQWILDMAGADFNLLDRVADFLFLRPGIFSVFSGRWMLADV